MGLNNGTFIGYTKPEFMIIIVIILTIFCFYLNLKSVKKYKTMGLSLDELIDEAENVLGVNELTEKDIEYLKNLGSPEEQNNKQITLLEFEKRNAITELCLLIPGLIITLSNIELTGPHIIGHIV